MFSNDKKKDNSINPIASAVTGAVVGAGVAIAAAQALKNENAKKKVKEVVTAAKDQAVEYINSHKDDVNLEEGKDKLKKVIKNKSSKSNKK